MWSWLLFACGGGEPVAPAPEPAAPAAPPTADQVLARHAEVTRQCEILPRDNFTFQWKITTDDGHKAPRKEDVLYQGAAGRTFMRLHQHREPTPQFVAFGQAPDGKVWSASETAIQTDLPEEAANALKIQLDPTPLCNWGQRWPVREMRGAVTFQEFPAWQLDLVWVDGAETEMYFHRESGLLMGSRVVTDAGTATTTLTDYAEIPCAACPEGKPVLWPRKERVERKDGPILIKTTHELTRAAIDSPDYKPLGPADIARELVLAAQERAAATPP